MNIFLTYLIAGATFGVVPPGTPPAPLKIVTSGHVFSWPVPTAAR